MQLNEFSNNGFQRGASAFKEAAWIIFSGIAFSTWLPGASWRRYALRLFGAKIGRGVVIKSGVRIKFPWRLTIGDYAWIGESAWIDNLASVEIGKHSCISQGAYLCTGSHDWGSSKFDLVTKPIRVGDYAWICAFARVAPGAVLGEGAVIGFGCVCSGTLNAWSIYKGSPAAFVGSRVYTVKDA